MKIMLSYVLLIYGLVAILAPVDINLLLLWGPYYNLITSMSVPALLLLVFSGFMSLLVGLFISVSEPQSQ